VGVTESAGACAGAGGSDVCVVAGKGLAGAVEVDVAVHVPVAEEVDDSRAIAAAQSPATDDVPPRSAAAAKVKGALPRLASVTTHSHHIATEIAAMRTRT